MNFCIHSAKTTKEGGSMDFDLIMPKIDSAVAQELYIKGVINIIIYVINEDNNKDI